MPLVKNPFYIRCLLSSPAQAILLRRPNYRDTSVRCWSPATAKEKLSRRRFFVREDTSTIPGKLPV
jgi:hypothetical protein